MTAVARTTTQAAQKADEAADELLDWLRQQPPAVLEGERDTLASDDQVLAGSTLAARPARGEPSQAKLAQDLAKKIPGEAAHNVSFATRAGDGMAISGPPLRMPHTDWLHHRLVVTGPADALVGFLAAASGAGTIPWTFDGDRMEEDLFLLLVGPSAPQRRRLSLDGARALARQLREAAELRHAVAVARVGQSRACPLDLHALLPVPPGILRLGPDHQDALAWLWTHWGTTDSLRHVTVEPALALRTPLPPEIATLRISLWSADWTPWRALAAVRARWPMLCFDIRPTYSQS